MYLRYLHGLNFWNTWLTDSKYIYREKIVEEPDPPAGSTRSCYSYAKQGNTSRKFTKQLTEKLSFMSIRLEQSTCV